MADLTPRERELIEPAFHESGHAIGDVLAGGVLRSAVVSSGLRHGYISGLTTFELLPPGREPEMALPALGHKHGGVTAGADPAWDAGGVGRYRP